MNGEGDNYGHISTTSRYLKYFRLSLLDLRDEPFLLWFHWLLYCGRHSLLFAWIPSLYQTSKVFGMTNAGHKTTTHQLIDQYKKELPIYLNLIKCDRFWTRTFWWIRNILETSLRKRCSFLFLFPPNVALTMGTVMNSAPNGTRIIAKSYPSVVCDGEWLLLDSCRPVHTRSPRWHHSIQSIYGD